MREIEAAVPSYLFVEKKNESVCTSTKYCKMDYKIRNMIIYMLCLSRYDCLTPVK